MQERETFFSLPNPLLKRAKASRKERRAPAGREQSLTPRICPHPLSRKPDAQKLPRLSTKQKLLPKCQCLSPRGTARHRSCRPSVRTVDLASSPNCDRSEASKRADGSRDGDPLRRFIARRRARGLCRLSRVQQKPPGVQTPRQGRRDRLATLAVPRRASWGRGDCAFPTPRKE